MSVLIDGATGEVIGPIPRHAKQAKPTFEGATSKSIGFDKVGTALVRTRVIRRYRGFRETQPITNRNQPPSPTAKQMEAFFKQAEKMGRRLNRQMSQTNPLLGAIGEILLDQFKKQRPR